jgi:hypothetical protein
MGVDSFYLGQDKIPYGLVLRNHMYSLYLIVR